MESWWGLVLGMELELEREWEWVSYDRLGCSRCSFPTSGNIIIMVWDVHWFPICILWVKGYKSGFDTP